MPQISNDARVMRMLRNKSLRLEKIANRVAAAYPRTWLVEIKMEEVPMYSFAALHDAERHSLIHDNHVESAEDQRAPWR